MNAEEVPALLSRLGLDGTLKQVTANKALAAAIAQTVTASGRSADDVDKGTGALLCAVAAGLPDGPRAHRRDVVSRYIGEGRLTTATQVAAAVDFFKKRGPDAEVTPAEFAAACGADIVFTDAQIAAKVGAEGARQTTASAGCIWNCCVGGARRLDLFPTVLCGTSPSPRPSPRPMPRRPPTLSSRTAQRSRSSALCSASARS